MELQQRNTAARIANENDRLRTSALNPERRRHRNRRAGGVYIIPLDGATESTPPPEYKWEWSPETNDELPPSYEDALNLSNEELDQPQEATTAAEIEQQ